MTPWKNFLIRFASATVAGFLVLGLFLWQGALGLQWFVVAATLIGTFETTRVLFHRETSALLKFCFGLLSLLVFGISINTLNLGAISFSLCLIFFLIFIFLQKHRVETVEQILSLQSKGALGFFYCGLLPSFVYKVLTLENGTSWFLFLLLVVFSSDIMAYVLGVLLGKNKIMPSISPKKSWQGAFGGLLGSTVAGFIAGSILFTSLSLAHLVFLALVAGLVGQFGDFFESLLKRVADVKDSGRIMPGHGGVLDRIDGVLFASPVILLGSAAFDTLALLDQSLDLTR